MAVLRNRSIPAASTRVPSAIRVLSPSLVAMRAPTLETTMISTVWGNQARPAWIGEYPRISCRYSELKKTAPIITTETSAATELPATTELSLSIRVGRRGWLRLFSSAAHARKSAAERARATSTFVEAKPCPVASVTPYARATIPPVRLTAPGTSRLTFASWRAASAASTGDSRTAARPNGTFTKSVKRQLNASVSRPPRINPADAPPAAIALQIPSARLRSGPSSKVVVRSDNAAGETKAPAKPWITRAAISIPPDWLNPPNIDAPMKRTKPVTNMRRRPTTSASRPPSMRKPPKVSAYTADHPLDVLSRQTQSPLHRGQRDVDDRDVQDQHELRRAKQREYQIWAMTCGVNNQAFRGQFR